LTGLAFVPLDDRPCCRDFPVALAPLAGWRLDLPTEAMLGRAVRPGDADALLDWLDEAPGRPLASVDMLVSGGLVASRSLDLSEADVERRMDRLQELLRDRDALAFNVLMRVPPFCTSDDERRFSERLMAYSKAVARGSSVRAAWARRGIPAAFLERYQRARARNHRVNLRFLRWTREGLLRYGLLGMDDSATEGFNVTERRILEPHVTEGRAGLIPGADELAMLLLARAALEAADARPRVEVRYAPESLRARVTRYEDRPVSALIAAHLAVLRARPVERGGDLVLFVHGPSRSQGEASTQLPRPVPSRVRAFAREIAATVAQGRLAAVADLGFANGADRSLVSALMAEVPLVELAAYAAWNTGGNTVGTALAHAVLRWLSLEHPLPGTDPLQAARAHVAFLYERFLDDWAYQAGVRQEVGLGCALRGLNIYDLGVAHDRIQEDVSRRLLLAGEALFDGNFSGSLVRGPGGTSWRVKGPPGLAATLPWPRIFEVRVQSRMGLEPA